MNKLNFPSNPGLNEIHVVDSRTWKFNGKAWRYQPTPVIVEVGGTTIPSPVSTDPVNPPSTGGGSGSGGPEHVLTLNTTGPTVISRTNGFNFYLNMTGNGTLANPVGYAIGDKVRITVTQDAVGNRTLGYDTRYAHPKSQVPILSTAPNSIDVIEFFLTQNNIWITDVRNVGYGLVFPLVRIAGVDYYTMGVAAAAVNTLETDTPEQTAAKEGATLTVLRHGLGSESISTWIHTGLRKIQGQVLGTGERTRLYVFHDTRLAYQKGIINHESGSIHVADVNLSGGRNISSDGCALRINPGAIYGKYERIRFADSENGCLSAASDTSKYDFIDCMFEDNGQAGDPGRQGYTHNIYSGEIPEWSALRCTFQNSAYGHDIKTRALITRLDQVHARGSYHARELDMPNGGKIYANNCIFEKYDGVVQGNLIAIGAEGINAHPQEYIFRNCRFINMISGAGRDTTFVWNYNPNVKVIFIDCEFVGALTLVRSGTYEGFPTVNGIRGAYEFQNTGGPLGPLLPVGQPEGLT